MSDNYFDRYNATVKEEARQLKVVLSAIKKIAENCSHVWQFGDGDGGYLIDLMKSEVYKAIGQKTITSNTKKKQKIEYKIRKLIFERDAYRCVICDSHTDLSIDHIIAESKGGLTVIENLQTMCMPCNAKKGAN